MKRSIDLLDDNEKMILARQIVCVVQNETAKGNTQKAIDIVYEMIQ